MASICCRPEVLHMGSFGISHVPPRSRASLAACFWLGKGLPQKGFEGTRLVTDHELVQKLLEQVSCDG